MISGLLIAILIVVAVGAVLSAVTLYRVGPLEERAGRDTRDELRAAREESRIAAKDLREEISGNQRAVAKSLSESLDSFAKQQQEQLGFMAGQLKEFDESNRGALERIRETFDTRIRSLQEGNEKKIEAMRKAMSEGLQGTGDALTKATSDMAKAQTAQLEGVSKQLKELNESNQTSLDRVRSTFDERVKDLQSSNEKKLDEMRKTVDEKLHDTLEKRLGESFKLVSDRLETVHKGLGEMQSLAVGVGDLKRVLSNVKLRGTWAEFQLGALLDQVLTPDQYEKNVSVKAETNERVEFAVRLPGPNDEPDNVIYLPIDSKFPHEDYARLQSASELADASAVQSATDALVRSVKSAARDISEKYVDPPSTTDFAILFLATEGLYAEVLRQPGLVEELQQSFRVVVAGPTTLTAILSSLRVGFQTLAIERRASEVWRVLAAVKTEFGKFGGVLEKVKKQLNSASRTIEQTGVRTRAMERKLRTVEQMPDTDAEDLLSLPALEEEEELNPSDEEP